MSLRIAVVTNSLAIGGVRRIAIEQAHWLEHLGYRVFTVPLSQEDIWFDLINKRCINIMSPSKFSDNASKFLNLPIDLLLQRWVREGYHYSLGNTYFAPLVYPLRFASVTICHNSFPIQYGFVTKMMTGIPFVAHIHDTATFVQRRVGASTTIGRWLHGIEKMILKRAAAIIADSKRVSVEVERDYGLRCDVVYPGCYAHEKIPHKRGNYVLAFGRWAQERHPNQVLELYRELNCREKLIVAGSWNPPSEVNSFRSLLRKLGLEDSVEVLTSVSEEQVENLYLNARVYVHPQPENFDMPALEAAAHGCPIVVAKESGVSEIFEDEVGQYSVKSGDMSAFVDRVSRLLNDDTLAWRMGWEAWKIAKKYTWHRHVSLLETFL